MTQRLIKTKSDHRKLRALLTEAKHSIALTPAAGALTAGTRNVAYAGVTFASSTAEGNVVFNVTAGALPLGLSLNSVTGVLSGTPTQANAGGNAFSVTATDEIGNSQTNAYTLAVA